MSKQEETPSAIASVLAVLSDSGGLVGQFIGKEAAKALSSVIGSALRVPDAYFAGIAKGISADADAKTQVKLLIAGEVGKRALIDEALIDRMAQRWLGEQVGKQINREAVAVEAAADLKETPPEGDVPVDEDFLAKFNSYAECATTEQMQKLFGRVLAGEIRKPGTFSMATLHTLSLIDQRVAKIAEKVSPWIVGDFIPGEGDFGEGVKFSLISALEEAGLCYSPASRSRKFTAVNGQIVIAFDVREEAPLLYLKTEQEAVHPMITPLTTVGKQVFALVVPNRTDNDIREVATALLKTSGLSSIELGRSVRIDGVLRAGTSRPFDPPLKSEIDY